MDDTMSTGSSGSTGQNPEQPVPPETKNVAPRHVTTLTVTAQQDEPQSSGETTRLTPHNGVSSSETSPGDGEESEVRLRRHSRKDLRHAFSEVLPNEMGRPRSQTMAGAKEYAYNRLQEELSIAQTELKLKDEEVEKLLKVRDQIGEELEDLTASLFMEANNMVQDANVKRMNSEKRTAEANHHVEVLQAEVAALKQLVLTSTPATPNKHLHPQISDGNGSDKEKEKKKESKTLKPFWKTHRRSTSHHQFTQEDRQQTEAQSEARKDRPKEMDSVCFEEFKSWRREPSLSRDCLFLARIAEEDICTCLNFSNTQLAEKVLHCVELNTLAIEPIPGDSSSPRSCDLSGTQKLCNYKVKLGEDPDWYSISQHCRNRITAVCDFYTYIRYIQQGLVKSEDTDVFCEIVRLRKQMALARLGYV